MVLVSACKQLQENQAVAWISKTKEKNPPKQERLVFLEMTVHSVGETAENQRKTKEKTKVAENQVFWLDFCAKKGLCITSLEREHHSKVKYGVRSPKFILAPCAQLYVYSLAETPQPPRPPSPCNWAHYTTAYWSAKIDDISW